MNRRVLVAGIGNVFLGDDGFGVEVANRLLGRPLPSGVHVADYGIRGVHLAYELLDGWDALVMVDALPLEEAPGTLAVVRPELPTGPAGPIDSHTMNPAVVLRTLAGLGATLDEILVVGCQPASLEPAMSLSEPVAAAVEPACALVAEVLAGLGAVTT